MWVAPGSQGYKMTQSKSPIKKEAIWHYAELFLGISKYITCVVDFILD